MCKQSSAPFIERHCFHGMMSKEGATHMVLWWGFVLRNQRVGTDDWTRFQREVGPTIAPFPRRIPNSSCFCSEWSYAVQWMQSKGEKTLFFHNSRDVYYHKPFGKILAHAMIRFSSAIYGNHGVADQTKNTL